MTTEAKATQPETKDATHFMPLVIAELHALYSQIRARFHDLPPAVIIVSSGREGVRSPKLGHFGGNRWKIGKGKVPHDEIMIAGEGMLEGADGVLGTLLHEGAHALAKARGVKDTCGNGKRHNGKFKGFAEELGLRCEKMGSHGFALTSLTDASATAYNLEALATALAGYRECLPRLEKDTKQAARMVKFQCQCETPRTIRAARGTMEAGPVVCGICEAKFSEAEAEETGDDD